jgi:hypothetical protein
MERFLIIVSAFLTVAACANSREMAKLDLQATLRPAKDCAETQAFARELSMQDMNRKMDALLMSVDAWDTEFFCGSDTSASSETTPSEIPDRG